MGAAAKLIRLTWGLRWRMGTASLGQQRTLLLVERCPLGIGHLGPALHAGLLGCRALRQKQLLQLLGPSLVLHLFHEGQPTQVVDVA